MNIIDVQKQIDAIMFAGLDDEERLEAKQELIEEAMEDYYEQYKN